VRLWNIQLAGTYPSVGDWDVIHDAQNKLIHDRLVVYARADPRKISPSHDRSIEQTNESVYLFVQYHAGLS
jgi:hypothetical protein